MRRDVYVNEAEKLQRKKRCKHITKICIIMPTYNVPTEITGLILILASNLSVLHFTI